MKKLRVFQTVKQRRIVPGLSLRNLGTVLLFLLLLPYLITFLFGNTSAENTKATWGSAMSCLEEGSVFVLNTTPFGTERIPMEIYVADKLARSIDCNYEPEALKAQAVLLRSAILAEGKKMGFQEDIALEDKGYGEGMITDKVLKAVVQTKGVYLAYEKEPINGAYFEVSNGTTRNGTEVGLSDCTYLKTVPCERDFLSEDYMKIYLYEEQEFEKKWDELPKEAMSEQELADCDAMTKETGPKGITLYRDSADYVLYVKKEGEYASGEQIRTEFHIPSSCFSISLENDRVKVSVRGVGHGLGLSQFGANEMAKEEKDYVEILNYFFQNVTITKFE